MKKTEKTKNNNSLPIFLGAIMIGFAIILSSTIGGYYPYTEAEIINNESIPVIIYYENGNPIYGVYNDIYVAPHGSRALFGGRRFLVNNETILDTAESHYIFGCTQNKSVHFELFLAEFEATPVHLHFYEEPTISNNGTLINVINLERNFQNIINNTMIMYDSPNVTSPGTQIYEVISFGDKQLSGENGIDSPIILRINTCYLFEIFNGDGNSNSITYQISWHESRLDYVDYHE